MKQFVLYCSILVMGLILPAMAAPPPVTVAAILSTTGIAASHNLPLIPLIELAVDEINSHGGLLGSPLKLLLIDNHSTPIGSTRAARKAVNSHAVAVIGAHWSSHSLAMAPLLQQAGVPMITISTNPKITLTGNYIFRINFNDRFQGRMVAEFARKTLRVGNAVVLKNLNEAYCMTLTKYFSERFRQLGGRILLEGSYKGSAVNFQEIISQIKLVEPDIIFLPGYARDSGLFIKQSIQQGLHTTFIGADAWDNIQPYAENALEGNYRTAVWHPRMDTPQSRHLQEQYRHQYHSDDINFSAVPWYDAFMLLKDAVIRAKSIKKDKIRSALAVTRGFQGASGTITFDMNGDPVGKEMVILKYEKGNQVYVKTIVP